MWVSIANKEKMQKKFAIRCKYVCERVKKDSLLIIENKFNRLLIRKSSYADVAAGQVGESTVLSTLPDNPERLQILDRISRSPD